jgi:hypothetical protein
MSTAPEVDMGVNLYCILSTPLPFSNIGTMGYLSVPPINQIEYISRSIIIYAPMKNRRDGKNPVDAFALPHTAYPQTPDMRYALSPRAVYFSHFSYILSQACQPRDRANTAISAARARAQATATSTETKLSR